MSEILRRALIIPDKGIPEKIVLYVRGKHCGLPGLPGSMQTEDFHTRGTECACMLTKIIVQEVEVHGWLLSGSEELMILCCSFLTLCKANS